MAFILEVRADFACFTRPELKVERVSYPIITPSAARAVFAAILWKPAITWKIQKIEILKPIKWINIRRNEVKSKMSHRSAGLYIESDRTQRTGMLLRDVAYRIHADFVMTKSAGENDCYGKFKEMFIRRARKGQCIYQPYLGCREFSCDFRLIEDVAQEPMPENIHQDFGLMLYDMNYHNPDNMPNFNEKNISPMFYFAKAVNGVVWVPDVDSEEVKQ